MNRLPRETEDTLSLLQARLDGALSQVALLKGSQPMTGEVGT